jgi:hypothetical protein
MISDKAKAAILDKCCQKVDCLARGEVIDLEGAADLHQSTSPVTASARDAFEAWATSDNRAIQPLQFEERTDYNNHYYESDHDNNAFIGWKAAGLAQTPGLREAVINLGEIERVGGIKGGHNPDIAHAIRILETNGLIEYSGATLAKGPDTSTVCTTSNSDGSLASGMQMPATEGAITQRPAHPMDTISGGPVGPSDSSPDRRGEP